MRPSGIGPAGARLTLLALAALVGSGCSPGSPEAEGDISRGKLRLKTYGIQGEADRDYASFLKERCKVEVEYLAGEIKPAELKQIERYNDRMKQEIKKKFGDDILDKLFQEALLQMATRKEQEKQKR